MRKLLLVLATGLMLTSCVATKITNHISIGDVDLEAGHYIFEVIETADGMEIDIKKFESENK